MQKFFKFQDKKSFDIQKIGQISFLLGVFLLASAVGISIIFLLISVIISCLKFKDFFKDKWNYPFMFSSIFMLLSTFFHFQNSKYQPVKNIDPNLSLVGLINWIPLFLCFWAFQSYLNTQQKRVLTGKTLIYGSIPVIFSGILQLLNINGPFELFNGLIVWFQKPISDIGSLSGLFNNQNYAGLWMVMVWPFCLCELTKKNRNFLKKLIIFLVSSSFTTFIFLTDSRNALLGLIISTPIVLGTSSLIWYLPTLIILFLFLAIAVIPIFPDSLQIFMKSIIPSRLYTLFPEVGFQYFGSYPRVIKWLSAFNFIFERPIFGWGAASFPIIYRLKSGEWFGHAHNLPLELALSYGIIPSITIFTTYIIILFLAFKKLLNTEKILKEPYLLGYKRAWFASSLIFFLSHLVDIQYFDVRISIFCWILLAGLKTFLEDKEKVEEEIEPEINFLFR